MEGLPTLSKDLLEFIKESPTAFQAVDQVKKSLISEGFAELPENQNWSSKELKSVFTIRDDGALIALKKGNGKSLKMVGAHTDSPGLKIRPIPAKNNHGYYQVGVEVYGGPILSTWFDRDLSIAGRIAFLDAKNEIKTLSVDLKRAVAYIPHLAIHLSRGKKEERDFSRQTEMVPLLFYHGVEPHLPFKELLLKLLLEEQSGFEEVKEILDFDLFLYDVQPPAYWGWKKEFIAGARLDNLFSTYIGLRSFLAAESESDQLLVLNNHEEIGSSTFSGADGSFFTSFLNRIYGEKLPQILADSLMVSVDNAHGIHPNYAGQSDLEHAPILNKGPVIKFNANQRYATDCVTSSYFQACCEREGVGCQSFSMNADLACGSTIGSITSSLVGVKVVDVGVATFGMHSVREVAGRYDCEYLFKALKRFYQGL